MKIIKARWTTTVNKLTIKCSRCNNEFEVRADRWKVECTLCGKVKSIEALGEDYRERHGVLP